jgi:hypothetical protein
MLVFVDESGDSGFKLDRGSSTHFVVAAVCFRSQSEAGETDIAIDDFRKREGLPSTFEFHFSRTPSHISLGLLRTVHQYDFVLAARAVEKVSASTDKKIPQGNELHIELIAQTLQALPRLSNATIVIDGQRPKPLQSQIERRLKQANAANAAQVISKVKFRRSSSDNLLQLADAVSGAIFQSLTKGDDTYRKLLRRHEQDVRFGVWQE